MTLSTALFGHLQAPPALKLLRHGCAPTVGEVGRISGVRRVRAGAFLLLAVSISVVMVAAGFWTLFTYDNLPGEQHAAPAIWPAKTRVPLAPEGKTLVVTGHPRCPCTRASVEELALLMAHAQGRVSACILFYKPQGFSDEWAHTDLWESATRIPGVTVISDEGGAEARRFHADTSGFAALYGGDGRLLFNGGITAARGHAGDNTGRSTIERLASSLPVARNETPVFGCPIFASATNGSEEIAQ